MTSLGILQSSLQEESLYINKIAEIAAKKGVSVYRFTPFSYNEKIDRAFGKYFDNNKKVWIDRHFALPKYIYDRFFYPPSRRYHSHIHKQIKKIQEKVTFLGTGLPNKWEVYKALNENENLKESLPKTELLTAHSLSHMFHYYEKVLIKPIFSSRGMNIYIITKRGKGFSIIDGEKKQYHEVTGNVDDVYRYLMEHLCHQNYIVQSLLSLQRNGRPFDLRIVVQRTDQSSW